MKESNYKVKYDDFYRINLFNNMYNKLSSRNEKLKYKLNNVKELLGKLEYSIDDKTSFHNILIENVNGITNKINRDDKDDSKLLTNLFSIIKNDSPTKTILNQIFDAIEKYLTIDIFLDLIVEVNTKNEIRNKVFLSYAYIDKAYTVGLFYYFLAKDIYLYIDWMHNSKISSGIKLKSLLSKVLNEANQFLFLDTINSQLSMRGNYIIRQWCAWEVGNYFKRNINEKRHRKFYLSIYYKEQLKNRKTKNLLLEDFKPITNINSGLMH